MTLTLTLSLTLTLTLTLALTLTRLHELLQLVHEGQAVEVTHLWGQQAMTLCRTALVGMASRLELHVRLSVHEHGCQRQAMADPNPNPNPNPNPIPNP